MLSTGHTPSILQLVVSQVVWLLEATVEAIKASLGCIVEAFLKYIVFLNLGEVGDGCKDNQPAVRR